MGSAWQALPQLLTLSPATHGQSNASLTACSFLQGQRYTAPRDVEPATSPSASIIPTPDPLCRGEPRGSTRLAGPTLVSAPAPFCIASAMASPMPDILVGRHGTAATQMGVVGVSVLRSYTADGPVV
jgi:hypothetical protein